MNAKLPETVRHLVERFERNRRVFESGDYKEEQLRHEFLNPLFEALGWDVSNKAGLSETYKPVIHEESIKVAGASKAPDYTFRIGGRRVFFAEAKKPSVNVAEDIAPAFQLRRYAWTAKLPVSILTDFEEFAVYDCRIRPVKTDKASVGRTMLLSFNDYLSRWDELVGLFSPEAIQKGALERYVESTKTKKGTAAVDDAFLLEISGWRELLARNIALRNPRLSTRELNFAVQRTIDRLIFLRICEDRGIESYAYLQSLLNGPNVYARLRKHFYDADDRYNSGLFHFAEEKGRAEKPDRLTLELAIDDKPLKDIISGLYYPDSPYEFSVMPAEVLGQVYEQFLGKVIRLTAGHQAKVEDKPEVRKAGGVYYTPAYIVDYIVKNTVGKLLEGSSPRPSPRRGEGEDSLSLERERARVRVTSAMTPTEAAKLKILDPACGSGSFLLGAYQYLLDWHLDYYQKKRGQGSGSKGQGQTYRDTGGNLRLTTAERKRILLNNIYGVDIDSQAVEVTKLSLLLKVLEGENQETLRNQLRFFKERALPDLGSNIKCGNSLIGPDFYQGEQQTMFEDEEERLRINVFDWNAAFPDIMKSGGFDAVIGNPPYIDIVGIPRDQREYFSKAYQTFIYRSDILGVFFERAIALLTNGGRLGFITSNTYFTSASASRLRATMLQNLKLHNLVDIGGGVFEGANVDTAVLIAERSKPSGRHSLVVSVFREAVSPMAFGESALSAGHGIEQAKLASGPNGEFSVASDAGSRSLVDKVNRVSTMHMSDVAESSRGYIAYDAYRGHSQQLIESRAYHSSSKRSAAYKKELVGSDIGRYALHINSEYWIKFGDNLAAPRHPRFHKGPRIWIQRIRNPKLPQRLVCYFTDKLEDLAASSGLTILRTTDECFGAQALTGLLNSRLVNWWYRQLYHDVNIKPADIAMIPIPAGWQQAQSKVGRLVGRMQELHKKLPKAKTPHERESIERTIAATDRQIDQLVYELYGLTQEEIEIVEGQTK